MRWAVGILPRLFAQDGKQNGGRECGWSNRTRREHSALNPATSRPVTSRRRLQSWWRGLRRGDREQTLLGVTGSGKTFTMANVIAQVNRPTLVLAHNKTLAAQLCSEFREFFPENAVEYFVSYYDYYQPEAYVPTTDTYIEKDSAINDEIDKLRHSATSALSERRDVIIVASVSCIYSLGDPIDYRTMVISLRPGMQKSRDELLKKLVEIQYERKRMFNLVRNKFRARGDVVEIFPAESNDKVIRVEFFGDEIDRISEINALTGEWKADLKHAAHLSRLTLYCAKGKDEAGRPGPGRRNVAAREIF